MTAPPFRLTPAQGLELIHITEDERRAIAASLHDGVVQWLTAISTKVQLLAKDASPERKADFEQVFPLVEAAHRDLYRMMAELEAPPSTGRLKPR